jgi:hypothetical protein
LAQYVYQSKAGLFRIVSHGRRWRALLDDREVGRFESGEQAIASLRAQWSRARVPAEISLWRYLPALALGHLRPPSQAAMSRLAAA